MFRVSTITAFFLFICPFMEEIYGGKRQNVKSNIARTQYRNILDY